VLVVLHFNAYCPAELKHLNGELRAGGCQGGDAVPDHADLWPVLPGYVTGAQ
jgi:hypothetical protein